MIYVYGNNITVGDKKNFNMIMGYAQVEEHEMRYIDLEHEDVMARDQNYVIAVGTKAMKAVTRDLTSSGLYSVTQLVGKDCIDLASKFLLYCIPMSFTEMVTNKEDKDLVWMKVQDMVQNYRTWVPFDDKIPKDLGAPKVVSPDVSSEADPEPEDTMVEVSEVVKVAEVGTKDVETLAPVPASLGEISIDVMSTLDALFEHVNLSDAGVGKSLSKYSKFTLHTGSGEIDVYPTNRMPKEDRFQICFKDLVTLIKLSTQTDCGTITFEGKDGNSISN